ncbi:clathrin interactor 1-like [Ornithodoros turicata]|uniref:clathrin interactor 1-like n=1 Tax=Ornithodoros turicata TaxID=34597 RepID=UPI003138EDB9
MNMPWKIREIVDKATNMVMNYTEMEAKVREATNDQAWGPPGQLMQEIAQATFSYDNFPEVMGMLWKRILQDNKRNYRRPYKGLLLLDYLVRNGSERVVTSSREHIYDLRSLENYTCIDELGKDQGLNVRQKVRDLIDFIQDDDRLREERKKAKKAKDKYIGLSGESLGFSRYADRKKGDMDDFELGSGTGSRFSRRRSSFEDSPENSNDEGDSDRAPYKDEPKSTWKATSKKIDLGAAANFGKESPQRSPSKASGGDLLCDTTDISNKEKWPSNGTTSGDTSLAANEDFADFSDFQGAATNAVTATASHDDFSDFASFRTAASSPDLLDTPLQSPAPARLPQSPLEATGNLLGPPVSQLLTMPPQQHVGPPGMLQRPMPHGLFPMQNTLMQSPTMPNPLMQSSLVQSPSMQHVTMQSPTFPPTNPGMMSSPLTPTTPVLMPQSTPQSLFGCPTSPMAADGGGANNTWSNTGSINISVDNLSLANKYAKAQAPSMNQLAGRPTWPH